MQRFLFPAIVLVCAVSNPAIGQAQPNGSDTPKVDPDSADFVIGTSTMPKRHWQTETRLTAERRGSMHEYGLGQTLIRYGLSERAEIRVGTPAYLISRDGGRMAGADDSSLEAKVRVYEGKKSAYGFYVDSILPTGSRRVAERRYQPSFRLASTFKLGEKLDFLANVGGRRVSMDQQRFSQFIAVASLQYDLRPKTKVFSEVYGFSRMEKVGHSQQFVDFGLIQLLNQRTSLDFRAGSGFNNKISGPDYFYQFGFSRLF